MPTERNIPSLFFQRQKTPQNWDVKTEESPNAKKRGKIPQRDNPPWENGDNWAKTNPQPKWNVGQKSPNQKQMCEEVNPRKVEKPAG